MYQVSAEYTGKHPTLCLGEWILKITNNETKETNTLRFGGSLNIEGTYKTWEFDKEYNVKWSNYESGLPFVEWVDCIPHNLKEELLKYNYDIKDVYLLEQIYDTCEPLDWRNMSCGGCI